MMKINILLVFLGYTLVSAYKTLHVSVRNHTMGILHLELDQTFTALVKLVKAYILYFILERVGLFTAGERFPWVAELIDIIFSNNVDCENYSERWVLKHSIIGNKKESISCY